MAARKQKTNKCKPCNKTRHLEFRKYHLEQTKNADQSEYNTPKKPSTHLTDMHTKENTWNPDNNSIMQTNQGKTHTSTNQLKNNTWQTGKEQQIRCTWPSEKGKEESTTYRPTQYPTNQNLAQHHQITVAEQPLQQLKRSQPPSFTSQKTTGYHPSQATTMHKKINQIFI